MSKKNCLLDFDCTDEMFALPKKFEFIIKCFKLNPLLFCFFSVCINKV